VSQSQLRAVLETSLKLIETGWTKDAYRRQIGDKQHYCAVGAVRRATQIHCGDDTDAMYTLRMEAFQQLQTQLPNASHWKGRFPSTDPGLPFSLEDNLILYNDESRDKRRIVNLFKRAISLLDDVNSR